MLAEIAIFESTVQFKYLAFQPGSPNNTEQLPFIPKWAVVSICFTSVSSLSIHCLSLYRIQSNYTEMLSLQITLRSKVKLDSSGNKYKVYLSEINKFSFVLTYKRLTFVYFFNAIVVHKLCSFNQAQFLQCKNSNAASSYIV